MSDEKKSDVNRQKVERYSALLDLWGIEVNSKDHYIGKFANTPRNTGKSIELCLVEIADEWARQNK